MQLVTKEVKEIIKELGIKQKHLAEKLGVSSTAITKYLSNDLIFSELKMNLLSNEIRKYKKLLEENQTNLKEV